LLIFQELITLINSLHFINIAKNMYCLFFRYKFVWHITRTDNMWKPKK